MDDRKYKPPGVPVKADTPGFNEFGVPWHACNGFVQDGHYWAWIRHGLTLDRLVGRLVNEGTEG